MITEACRDNLLEVASAYALARNLSLTTVANEFYGARKFFKDFEAGKRSVSLSKYDQMMQKFSDGWPDDTPWPRLRAIKCDRPPQTKQGKTVLRGKLAPGKRSANRLSGDR